MAHQMGPTRLRSCGPVGEGPPYGLPCYRPFVSELEPDLRAWRKRRGEEMMDSRDGRPEITKLGSS